MEKAVFVSKTAHLELANKQYARMYFGNEFCQNLIPEEKELELAIETAEKNRQKFTLVTPYVTDKGLEKLAGLFKRLDEMENGAEVVVNDWGVLRVLNKKHKDLEPVLGRLLNKMKRGPRILNVMDKLPETALCYFRNSNIGIAGYRRLLKKYAVKRIEFDNLLQGIEIDPRQGDIPMSGSIYLPYAYLTTTRLCLTNGCDVIGESDKIGIFPCKKECQRYTFRLTHKDMPVPIILKGNTQFFRNEKLPENLEANGIDRIVWQPEIPV